MSAERVVIMPGFLPASARLTRTHTIVHWPLPMAGAKVFAAMRRGLEQRVPMWQSPDLALDSTPLIGVAAETTFKTRRFAHVLVYGIGQPMLGRMCKLSGLRKPVNQVDNTYLPLSWLDRRAMCLLNAIDAPNDNPARVARATSFVALAILARCAEGPSSGSSRA
jgi:hypothetical protein